jgi:periplasmic protein TonB
MALNKPKVVSFPRRAKHSRHSRWHTAVARLEARMDRLERRLNRRTRRASLGTRMRFAIIGSLVFHVLLIIGVGVQVPPRPFNDLLSPKLEIVLVNAQSQKSPKKADVLAQHNLDGGGNTDEKARAQSPLPVLPDQKLEADVQLALRRVDTLEREAKQLMTQIQSKAAVETAPEASKAEPQPKAEAAAGVQTSDLLQKSFEIARQEAIIERELKAYQERPRARYVAARAKEVPFARYVEDWRQKVERIGEINYPLQARGLKLQAHLLVTVAVKSDGSLANVIVERSSGHKFLDESAKSIVQAAAPFSAFPPYMARDTDILYITRWWTFTSSGHLRTE